MTKQNDSTTVDRQTFFAERDRLAGQLATFQARLSDRALTAGELSALPGKIAETRASLGVIDARITEFELEDAEIHAQTLESDAVTYGKERGELAAAQQAFDAWKVAHDTLMMSPNQGAVKRVIDQYVEMLPEIVALQAATSNHRDALLDLQSAREVLKGLREKQERTNRLRSEAARAGLVLA